MQVPPHQQRDRRLQGELRPDEDMASPPSRRQRHHGSSPTSILGAAVKKTARDIVLGKVEIDIVPGTVEATNGNDLAVDLRIKDTASVEIAHPKVPTKASNADDREAEIIVKNDNTSATIVARGTKLTAKATTVTTSGNMNVTELVHGKQKNTNLSPDRRQRLAAVIWTL